MEKKYTILRVIATLYKIVAVIILVVMALGAVFTVIAQPRIDFGFGLPTGPLVLALTIAMVIIELLLGGLIFLGVYALGDLISLLINIEENTRFSALLLRDRMTPAQPMAQAPAPQPMPPAMQVPPPPPPYQQS